MRQYLIRSITLLCMILSYTNLSAQQEKVILWNPMAKCLINSSFTNFENSQDDEVLVDSVWRSIGPGNNDILGFAFGNNNAEIIYAASRDSGVFKTTDGGLNWIQTNNGISDNFIRAIASHPQNSNIVLAGTFNDGLYRTTDAGLTWNGVAEVNASTIAAVTFDHLHGDTVYVGTFSNGVYSSFDGGLTWRQTTSGSAEAGEVIVDPQFTNVIYYSNFLERRVFKSTDHGDTWNVFFEGAPILSLAIDPHDSNIIYMGTVGDSLYKSTDGGQNWNQLPISGIIEDILIDLNNSNNIYLAVVNQGVFHSADAGFTWEASNNGLTALEVLKLKFHPLVTSTLFVSTNYGAIFKIENTNTGINVSHQNGPREFFLFQNFPNPFNPSTTINYQLKRQADVKLAVYDLSGRLIETLINRIQNAAEYTINFNAAGLASGVYIYKLNTGSFEQSHKMLLLR